MGGYDLFEWVVFAILVWGLAYTLYLIIVHRISLWKGFQNLIADVVKNETAFWLMILFLPFTIVWKIWRWLSGKK